MRRLHLESSEEIQTQETDTGIHKAVITITAMHQETANLMFLRRCDRTTVMDVQTVLRVNMYRRLRD